MQQIIMLVGPPGSGKGTLAEKFVQNFAAEHISTGEVFRENMRKGTVLGKAIDELMKAGELVPDKIVVDLVTDKLGHLNDDAIVVLDGFPRTAEQVQMFNRWSKENNRMLSMLVLQVDSKIARKRISDRYVADPSRVEDANEESVKKRFHEYVSKTSLAIFLAEKTNDIKMAYLQTHKDEYSVYEEAKKILDED